MAMEAKSFVMTDLNEARDETETTCSGSLLQGETT